MHVGIIISRQNEVAWPSLLVLFFFLLVCFSINWLFSQQAKQRLSLFFFIYIYTYFYTIGILDIVSQSKVGLWVVVIWWWWWAWIDFPSLSIFFSFTVLNQQSTFSAQLSPLLYACVSLIHQSPRYIEIRRENQEESRTKGQNETKW